MQQRQIEDLKAAVAEQAARIAQLERRLGRNSGNSSMPPSTDVFHKPERPAAPTSGRRRGNQPGAPGGGLALVEHPEQTEHAFPEVCEGCGALFGELGEVDSVGYSRRQRTDIPPVSARVVQTRFHTVACCCDPPGRGRSPTGQGRAAGRAALRLIRALLTLGHVLHADETTTRIGTDQRRCLHVASTRLLTYLALAPRSRAGVNGPGILPHFRGTLIHDAYVQLYDGYPHASHQLCLAHVIRELTAQVEAHPRERWADQTRWALSRLIEQAAAARAAGLDHVPPERATVYLRVLRAGVAVPPVRDRRRRMARDPLLRLQLLRLQRGQTRHRRLRGATRRGERPAVDAADRTRRLKQTTAFVTGMNAYPSTTPEPAASPASIRSSPHVPATSAGLKKQSNV